MSAVVHSAARVSPPTSERVGTPISTNTSASTAQQISSKITDKQGQVWVTFYADVETFILFGDSGVAAELTATTDGFPIPAGTHQPFLCSGLEAPYFSAILASGTGTLYWYLS